MSPLGLVHTGFALAALLCGTLVVAGRKGGRLHRTLGHLYLSSMLVANITALLLYNLTGHFNFFHASALASLASLTAGIVPILLHRPRRRWLELHSYGMNGSYVGVVAATLAEIFTRLAGAAMSAVVGITTVIVVGIGIYLIHVGTPLAIQRLPAQREPIGE